MSGANNILVLNAGSSSLKAGLFAGDSLKCSWNATKKIDLAKISDSDLSGLLCDWLETEGGIKSGDANIRCIGHRIVHGGSKFITSTVIDGDVLSEIEAFSELAPLHNPIGLKVLAAARKTFSNATHVAAFDTAFHATIAEHVAVYPLPYDWYAQKGFRRYGFHGISHAYCSRTVLQLAGMSLSGSRVVTCHLGNGCSLAAVRDGKSCDTTMGYTPLEGLMMGTRSGNVDPGLLLEILKDGMSPVELEETLNKKSGLSGISGVGQDMRDVEKAMSEGDKRAMLAHKMFVHRIGAAVAAMSFSIGGIDILAFTGGIGEHSKSVRADVCGQLSFLGVELDSNKNESCERDTFIQSDDSKIKVAVIEAREDLEIATECRRLVP